MVRGTADYAGVNKFVMVIAESRLSFLTCHSQLFFPRLFLEETEECKVYVCLRQRGTRRIFALSFLDAPIVSLPSVPWGAAAVTSSRRSAAEKGGGMGERGVC